MATKYKNEWKYFCSNYRLDGLLARLKNVMKPDVHTDNNAKYIVHSLYFDDINNSCLNDVEAGNPSRFKFRIRYYNNDLSSLKLEKKEKLYGYCRKYYANLTEGETNLIINGEYCKLFWGTKNKLLKRILFDLIKGNFKPKVITKYERTALEETVQKIRVTIDKNITSSVDFKKFLSGKGLYLPLTEGNRQVLEIKFNQYLPDYIKRLCYSNFMSRQTFSKYYLAVKNMREKQVWSPY